MKQRTIKILEVKNMTYKEMKDGNIILLASNRLVTIEFVNDEYVRVYDETQELSACLLDTATIAFDFGMF